MVLIVLALHACRMLTGCGVGVHLCTIEKEGVGILNLPNFLKPTRWPWKVEKRRTRIHLNLDLKAKT